MGGMPPVLLHFTRETRPWQHPPLNGSEWFGGCAASVCAVVNARGSHAGRGSTVGSGVRGSGSGAALRIGRLGALHAEWRTLCSSHKVVPRSGGTAEVW